MKLLSYGLLFSLSLTLSQNSFAREFANGLSYIGSKWQEYKQLPYEKCAIRHTLDGSSYHKAIWSESYVEFEEPSFGFFAPFKNLEVVYADYYLTCWTGVNNWAFAVPIHLDKLSFKGFALELMGNALKFDFQHLNDKKLGDIEGEYGGYIGSLGLLAAGFKRATLKNETDVHLKVRGWYAGAAGVSFGKAKFRVQLGKDRTHLVDKTDSDKVTEIADLTEYTFKKVKWNSIPVPPPSPTPSPAVPAAAPGPEASPSVPVPSPSVAPADSSSPNSTPSHGSPVPAVPNGPKSEVGPLEVSAG